MKKLISIFLVLMLSVGVLSGCEKKEDEHSRPNIQSSNEYFYTIEEYYDFFFSLYKYEDDEGNVEVMDYIEADIAKYNYRGEDYYNFVDDIQKGERKIYIPKISDEWEFKDITLYEKSGALVAPYVSFEYNRGEERLFIGYSYIPSYYLYSNVVVRDGQPVFVKQNNSSDLRRYMYKRKGVDYDESVGNTFSEVYQQEIQLKDRSVLASFYKYKEELYSDACNITFIYDDVCVQVERLSDKMLTDDFLKDFTLEEYVHPETNVESAETTQLTP